MIDRNSPRYLAVYGASIAIQAWTRIDRGYGPADDYGMECFVEEAHAVAEHSEQQQPDTDEVALQAQRDRVFGAALRAWRCPHCLEMLAPGVYGMVTCGRCVLGLKTLVAKIIAAEALPPSACVPSIEGARGLDSLTDAQNVPEGHDARPAITREDAASLLRWLRAEMVDSDTDIEAPPWVHRVVDALEAHTKEASDVPG